MFRVRKWKIPKAELVEQLRSRHQTEESMVKGEGKQDHLLTKKGKPVLYNRCGFKSTTMQQIQEIWMKGCLKMEKIPLFEK